MEQFYKKIRKRSDEKPRLMTALIAIFYFCIGMGFVGLRYRGTLSMVVSCLLCIYMSTMVYAIVKGHIPKAIYNCLLFFALGVLFTFKAALQALNYSDLGFAFGIFVVIFGLGMGLGHIWYSKYMD